MNDLLYWLSWQRALTQFFTPPAGINVWSIVNSQFFTSVVLGAVTVYFARRAQNERERADDIVNAQSSLEDLEGPRGATANGNPAGREEDHFARAKVAMDALKGLVDETVGRISDGRKLRKYENIGRRDYRLIVAALGGDGLLPDEVAGSLIRAFELWRGYRSHVRRTPADVADELERTRQRVTSGPATR
jgi:hypothetical protein